ncbi:HNH endonuclease, partial [Flavobacterium psychrophilum]|nr:HNH endonuclease [Flavobacterium psychrophilum]
FEWKKKKEEINFRDNYLCVICGAFETELDNNSNYIWKKNIFSDNKSKIDINSLIEKFPKWKPNKEYKLHVHHKLYKKNKLPWDYENHNLITLCNNCHENIHKFINIPVLNEFDITIDDYVTCDRCNGSGYFPEYNHIKNGICFKCNGERYNLFIIDKNIPI